MQLVGNFVGFDTTTHIATIYDCEVLMIVLMIVYNKLTLIVVVVVEHVANVAPRLGVFGCWISFKETIVGFLKAQLSLFKRTFVQINPFNPLIWWVEHEG